MQTQPTMFGIVEAMKATTANAISAKGVAEQKNFENTSENLRWIQDEMFDLVQAGLATAFRIEGQNGGWFFNLTDK